MKKWLPEELEEIPCDFCDSRDVAREFIRKDGMRVVECAQCGLAYLNPRPKPEFIPRFYEADYFTGVTAERGEGGLKCTIDGNAPQSEMEQENSSRAILLINKNFGGLKGKDVLEIGCATGELLLAIKNAGARARGLEISDFAAGVARKRGLDVATGTIENFVQGNEEKFDIVIALEVLEHVLSPTQFIANVAEVIKPGGFLVLSTPNYSCVNRFGHRWYGFNASYEHLYFFSLQILRKIGLLSAFYVKYVESSELISLPGGKFNYVEHVIQRFKTLTYIVSEIGFLRTLDNILRKSTGCHSYAIGHIITVVFEKK